MAIETSERAGNLADTLDQMIGSENVLKEHSERDYISRDLSYLPYELADIVARPGNTEELAAVVQKAVAEGYAVVPRGGGMSYTLGYTPERKNTVSIDFSRMDKIVEINTEDMYVIVEVGCTWKDLYETLKKHNVRTPYYGPLSGMYATVGGAVSQNSVYMGGGEFETAADSVIGLEVVLANGQILRTGSWVHRNSNPHFRHFGPNLSGIFTADTGAFGLKARVALKLITLPAVTETMSFAFDSLETMFSAQIELARYRIAAETYGFDPYYNAAFEKLGFEFKEGVTTLRDIATKGGLSLANLLKSLKVAAAGKKVLRDVQYSLHVTFNGHDEVMARAKLKLGREICLRHQGREIDNSIPIVFSTKPFDFAGTIILGHDGEIWLPIHGFVPLSKAIPLAQAVEKLFADNSELMEKHDIRTSYLTCLSGTDFLIEPSFYWYDEVQKFRLDRVSPANQERWKDRKPNLEARKVALDLRDQLRDVFFDFGASHLQIGRYYKYREAIENEPFWTLLETLKSNLDPDNLINPGSLGLDTNR